MMLEFLERTTLKLSPSFGSHTSSTSRLISNNQGCIYELKLFITFKPEPSVKLGGLFMILRLGRKPINDIERSDLAGRSLWVSSFFPLEKLDQSQDSDLPVSCLR